MALKLFQSLNHKLKVNLAHKVFMDDNVRFVGNFLVDAFSKLAVDG